LNDDGYEWNQDEFEDKIKAKLTMFTNYWKLFRV